MGDDTFHIGLNMLLLKLWSTKKVGTLRRYLFKYCRSGNFRVKKLLYDKFSCKKIFVGTTPYHISINSAC